MREVYVAVRCYAGGEYVGVFGSLDDAENAMLRKYGHTICRTPDAQEVAEWGDNVVSVLCFHLAPSEAVARILREEVEEPKD